MKLIINADDFGMSKTVNEAIVAGYNNGVLTSTCIMANMPGFEHALKCLEKMQGIGLGIHLNIVEKKTTLPSNHREHNSKLYNKEGCFNNGFVRTLIKSYDEDFMMEVENEFRSQIEKVLEHAEVDHIDSHVHIHSIPKIFDLVCRLAKEYKIPCVRTQFEKPYFGGNFRDFISLKYYINLIKVLVLNFFTIINKRTIKKYDLYTNDRLIGVGYTSMMNEKNIVAGIKAIEKTNYTIEIICHPDLDIVRKSNYIEYQAVVNEYLKNFVKNYKVMTYKNFIE